MTVSIWKATDDAYEVEGTIEAMLTDELAPDGYGD